MQKHGSAQTSGHVSAASSPSKLHSSHGSAAASPAKKDKQSAIMPAILEFDFLTSDKRFPGYENWPAGRQLCSAHAERIRPKKVRVYALFPLPVRSILRK